MRRKIKPIILGQEASVAPFQSRKLDICLMGEQQSFPKSQQRDLSIIIPVRNEANNLVLLHEQLNQALASLERSYEILSLIHI